MLYELLSINIEIIAVNSSLIGKANHTKVSTSLDKVNTYTSGKTNITNLSSEIIKGLNA